MNSNQQPPEEIEGLKIDSTSYSENEFESSKNYDLGSGLKISVRKIQPSKKPRGVLAE